MDLGDDGSAYLYDTQGELVIDETGRTDASAYPETSARWTKLEYQNDDRSDLQVLIDSGYLKPYAEFELVLDADAPTDEDEGKLRTQGQPALRLRIIRWRLSN